jgi:hypothetical protein
MGPLQTVWCGTLVRRDASTPQHRRNRNGPPGGNGFEPLGVGRLTGSNRA